ncbi:MAG: aminoglycoside phosphotransferase family protein [Prevotellaceae bacterium]|jgi:serine/threonine protein kinase|nr:aminoglycoside phosphotransferase family protein [Prevotellaceae bacterium]
MSDNKLVKIVSEFISTTGTISVDPLGAGHINDSYIIVVNPEGEFLMQRINHYIFKDVDALQNNILRVTKHIRHKLESQNIPDIDRRVLTLLPTHDGKWYYRDNDGNYWRMMKFISDSVSYEAITPELAYKAGRAFGEFQSMLADIPGGPLTETIPNFHNMESRLETFREVVKNNLAGRLSKVQDLVDEIEKRAEDMTKAERMHREGKLPKRINHCDTKVNNILFDKTGNVLCVVDLDTVMPGYVLSDFGDFMRTGANNGAEDDADLNKVSINLDIFEAYTKGYLETAKSFLTPVEVENLAFGAKLLTYMQTVRFLSDYIDGDKYYKIHSPKHNLQRSNAQFKLLQSMEENFDRIQEIVNEAAK